MKMARLLVLGTIVVMLPATASARTWYVDDDNCSGKEKGTAKYPFPELSAAIKRAANGDTIKVAAGTYPEVLEITAKELHLEGGYRGATQKSYAAGKGGSFNKRDVAAYRPRLQGTDAHKPVLTLMEAGITTVDGFFISAGDAQGGNRFDYGGGIYCEGGKPTISNNVIEDNYAKADGGGIHITDSHATVVDNQIRNNRAGRGALSVDGGNTLLQRNHVYNNVILGGHGGGIFVSGPNLKVYDNLVESNRVGVEEGYGWGAGILVHTKGTSAHLRGDVVRRNSAPSAGSGVFIDDGAEALIENTLIDDNACPKDGGAGIYVDGADWMEGKVGSKATLRNVTVANHRCNLRFGDGLYVEVYSSVTIENSIFWNHAKDFYVDNKSTLTVRHSSTSAATKGEGNRKGDCLFADPANGDFHLRSKEGRYDPKAEGGKGAWVKDKRNSPCIDAGNPKTAVKAEPPPNGGRVNLGAYGNTAYASRSAKPAGP